MEKRCQHIAILYCIAEKRREAKAALALLCRNTLDSWKPVSDRIIFARFCSNAHRHVTIVQCYAPTKDADYAVKHKFYLQLTAVLSSIRRGDITLLLGDFNAGATAAGY